jgi:hypothetical protein
MPALIKSLQRLLIEYPNWEITLTLCASEGETRPAMGLVILVDEIIDGLRREYLRQRFNVSSTKEAGCWDQSSAISDILSSPRTHHDVRALVGR